MLLLEKDGSRYGAKGSLSGLQIGVHYRHNEAALLAVQQSSMCTLQRKTSHAIPDTSHLCSVVGLQPHVDGQHHLLVNADTEAGGKLGAQGPGGGGENGARGRDVSGAPT